jgi:hypothetical protein
MPSPRRGEVWLVDLGMAAKVRPALVISVPPVTPIGRSSRWCRTRRAHDNRVSRRPSRFHFCVQASSTRRISLRFHTRSWCGRSDRSGALNSLLWSERSDYGSEYQRLPERPDHGLQPVAAAIAMAATSTTIHAIRDITRDKPARVTLA